MPSSNRATLATLAALGLTLAACTGSTGAVQGGGGPLPGTPTTAGAVSGQAPTTTNSTTGGDVAPAMRPAPAGAAANGCWVQLFDERNLTGAEQVVINGPVRLSSLGSVAGSTNNWAAEASSVFTGPAARVRLYPNERFAGESVELSPNWEAHDLDQYRMDNRARSLEVLCVGS